MAAPSPKSRSPTRPGTWLAVDPRTDDEPRRRARLRRRGARAQAGEVLRRADRPVAFVVPAAEVEDRHAHAARTSDSRSANAQYGPVVWMIEPVEVERRDALRARAGHGAARAPAPRARDRATTGAPREWTAARSATAPPAAIVRRDVLERPRQPRQVERAAEVEELPARREAHRRERADQMRRRLDCRQPLHRARIRQAGRRDRPVRPRLRRNPLDGVVAVEAFVTVRVEVAIANCTVRARPRRRPRSRARARPRQATRRDRPGLAVRRADEQHGRPRVARSVEVGAKREPVAQAEF